MFHDSDKTRRDLAASFHGRLAEVLPRLREAQRQGCGVYVAINRTDGRGRRKANIAEARVLFLDLDGTPLPESWPVEPDLIAHTSSPGDGVQKYQAYWLIDPTDEFGPWEACQKTLAEQFGGDPKCATRTQVARVAGFWHLKDPEHPHQVAIVHDSDPDLDLTWSLRLQATKLGLDLDAIRVRADAARQTRNEPPPYGYDNPADVAAARRLVAEESNWHPTSDGGVSVFKMACRLRDLGISPELAVELIEEHLPRRPASWADDHVERKVANAFRYGRGQPGERSREAVLHDFDEEPVDPEWAAGDMGAEEATEEPDRLDEGKHYLAGLHYRLGSGVAMEPISWLWENRIARGKVNSLSGEAGLGKTTCTMDLAARVTRGAEWPDGSGRAEQGYVIVLSAEDDAADTLVPRFMAAGGDPDYLIVLEPMVQPDRTNRARRMFNIADDVPRLERLLEEFPGVALLIIDPIGAYMGPSRFIDTFRDSDVRGALGPLKALAEKHDIAALFIGHFKKGGTGKAQERMLGSVAFTALARCNWVIIEETDQDDAPTGRALFAKSKQNIGEPTDALAYRLTGVDLGEGVKAPRVDWEGSVTGSADALLRPKRSKSAFSPKLESAKLFLFDQLSNGPMLAAEIRRRYLEAGHAEKTINRAKDWLGVESVRLDGRWYWRAESCEDDSTQTGNKDEER